VDSAEHAGNGVDVVAGDNLVAVQDISGVWLRSARSLHCLNNFPHCQLHGAMPVNVSFNILIRSCFSGALCFSIWAPEEIFRRGHSLHKTCSLIASVQLPLCICADVLNCHLAYIESSYSLLFLTASLHFTEPISKY